MSHAVIDRLAEVWPPEDWRDVTLVVAVSGGPDSVALLRALHALKQSVGGKGTLVAAHFNHRLRGKESDADQEFVRALCGELAIACETNDGQNFGACREAATDQKDELEADAPPLVIGTGEDSARQARYHYLTGVVGRRGARFLATAHTADDQAETVLHRILRGTGIEGLAGIALTRQLIPGVTLVRPLLQVDRHAILDFLSHLGQTYRVDSSNAGTAPTRNRLRLELLPSLARDYNPRVNEALLRLAKLAHEATEAMRPSIDELERSAVRRCHPNELVLDYPSLSAAEPYLVRQMLMRLWDQQGWPQRDMSLEKWSEIAELASDVAGSTTRLSLPGNVVVERRADALIIRRVRN